ncbi:MAG TPA: ABC transporter ATP-binding protein [Candidatus Binatia bacterium]|nr:ABC transporter ATP-binding protein [Candidatus Binatia bacterium]
MNPLVVRSVSRRFGGLDALVDVSMELIPGERRAIIGTNGAGKTTLFNILDGQIPPSSGEIWLFGENVTAAPTHRRAALGLGRTFQITSLFPKLTVLENMLIAVQALTPSHFSFVRPIEAYPQTFARSRELLEQWSLWDAKDEQVHNLSHGVQRKLEIVLALASEPKLLLLDEPMAGLSAAETHLTADIVLALDRSTTVLLIEHDLAAAFQIADRVTALDRGRIVAEGTPDEIRREARLNEIYLRGG